MGSRSVSIVLLSILLQSYAVQADETSQKAIAKESFHFSDLLSSYHWRAKSMHFPHGDTFKIGVRYQEEWRPLENPVADIFPVIGRNGETVCTCKDKCETMPELRTPDLVIIFNEWNGKGISTIPCWIWILRPMRGWIPGRFPFRKSWRSSFTNTLLVDLL